MGVSSVDVERYSKRFSRQEGTAPYFVLFFCSGFAALIYQIVWQRALFTLYGMNVEAVTVIVTVFMLGLGIGSLAGGSLSKRSGLPLLLIFGLIELSIGAYGALSLRLFHQIGALTAGASLVTTGIISFALLLIPTMLMGSTLPLLAEHFVRRTGNVGESVGLLYAVNTLGSGLACFFAAIFIMRTLGEAGAVWCAASVNLFVGLLSLSLHVWFRNDSPLFSSLSEDNSFAVSYKTIPLAAGMLLAASVGFISLAYEIVWYRLFSFTYGSRAACFAMLLAFYLFGIAYGSIAVRDAVRGKQHDLAQLMRSGADIVILGSVAAFLVGPGLSFFIVHVPLPLTMPLIYPLLFASAALLGAVFPLISHAAIHPGQDAGRNVSLIYLSNIIGSVLGSFLVGFVILDHISIRATSSLLLTLGIVAASVFAWLSGVARSNRIFIAGVALSIFLVTSSGWSFSGLYERLLEKTNYKSSDRLADVIENRSGVIAVSTDGIVYGGGIYDGRFNTDLLEDTNGLFRAFAIPELHHDPQNVLVIGLSSGSWVQVVANNPAVKNLTVIEINPGYLSLIAKHANVAALLRNPKVHIVVDDGRRWLAGHPNQRFDFILMNTTFHWRANVSNLLSVEFMQILRSHLDSGGVAYYNTTWSDRALVTGSTVFPYALRISNFLAVSDSPIVFDHARWREELLAYQIEGRPVFDLSNPVHRDRLDEILKFPMLETRESLLTRFKDSPLITDDNMGTEWQSIY